MSNYNRNRLAYDKLQYHLVVVTKYRHECMNDQIMLHLEKIANRLFSKWKCEIVEFGGERDHMPILFEAPPQINLATIINSFKTVSSRYIRKEFAEHLKPYYFRNY